MGLSVIPPGFKSVYRGFTNVYGSQDGYEIVSASDAVAILVYIKDRNQVVFVRQQRPPMVTDDNPLGMMLELIAGRFDCALDAKNLAVKEALEEAGIVIHPDEVVLLNGGQPLGLSTGLLTERTTIAYAEVRSHRVLQPSRKFFGNADEHELTERVFVSVDELYGMQFDAMTSLAAVNWFLRRRKWWQRLISAVRRLCKRYPKGEDSE